MLESKSWYSKRINKNVKSAKMMGFINIYEQYPRKLNFVHFSDLSEKSPSAYDKNLEESFAWEA